MNNRTTPKDFFLHLGAVVALYTSAIALINLAFSVVNYYNPDALAGYFSASSVAWPVSMLVVLIPVLYVIEWLIGRDLVRQPEKREIWIRRWRIYLTLFLAGATIVGDLITLINTYLNGEVTSRFMYKILIVLLIAGVIFAYYLLARALESARAKRWRTILAWSGIIVVLISIIAGFMVVGSPNKQRALRFDAQRVSDLSNIQYQVVNYWQQKGALPAALSDLNDSISGFSAPVDPDTKAAYTYEALAPISRAGVPVGPSFQVCADFALESQDTSGRGAYNGYGGGIAVPMTYPSSAGQTDSLAHPAGHACFDRTIDPSRYPPNVKASAI